MTFRDRYLNTLLFKETDRVPLFPGLPRESTLETWHKQGLPEDADYYGAMLDELGLPPMKLGIEPLSVTFQMLPAFEEKVIEHRQGHYLVRDWSGAIVEISDEFDVSYLRFARDFVTRKWHKFPVGTPEDWERMKERYRVDAHGRFPEDFKARCASLQERESVLYVMFNGPFCQLREWCGLENLCMLLIEQPEFVREMVAFWEEFVSGVLSYIDEHISLDRVCVSEDMAYKAHSMVSPEMTRRFFSPTYRKWTEQIKSSGCPIVDMDSDGYIGELLPIWIEAGINVCFPIEVAAHNDIIGYRKNFGRRMAYVGGVDKRAMAAGGKVIEAEIERLAPLVKDGGYIPSCDHGVPPDVSWPNYINYSRLLAHVCGWL